MIMSLDMKDCGVKNVRPWHKADVKTYSIGKLLDAAISGALAAAACC